jgi:hypothetical protein
VDARDAHRPGLGVEPRREAAQGVHPSADPALRLEDQWIVALSSKLEGGNQAGHAGADDDHSLSLALATLEAVAGDREYLLGDGNV